MTRARFAICLPLMFAFAAALASQARDGVLDPRFGNAGIARVDVVSNGNVAGARAVLEQPDGKLVLVGSGRANGTNVDQPAVVRLTRDGQLDSTFANGGVFFFPDGSLTQPWGANANRAAVLPDGRIVVVGGRWQGFNNAGCTLIFAVTASGALDSSYGPGPGPACVSFGFPYPTNQFFDLAGQITNGPGNKVYVSGLLGSGAPGSAVVARLDEQGAFDTSFSDDGLAFVGTGFYAGAFGDVESLPDGSILLLGGSAGVSTVVRILESGSIDAGFGDQGFARVDIAPDSELADGLAVIFHQENGKLRRKFL